MALVSGFRNGVKDCSVFLWFFDSMYYFSPSDFSATWLSSLVDLVGVTGGNFFNTSGTYDLPLGEGRYSTQNGKLLMNTRGGSEVYSHPHTHYDAPIGSYDSGWYTWFYDLTPYDSVSRKLSIVCNTVAGT
jgi:hypothetical protein